MDSSINMQTKLREQEWVYRQQDNKRNARLVFYFCDLHVFGAGNFHFQQEKNYSVFFIHTQLSLFPGLMTAKFLLILTDIGIIFLYLWGLFCFGCLFVLCCSVLFTCEK